MIWCLLTFRNHCSRLINHFLGVLNWVIKLFALGSESFQNFNGCDDSHLWCLLKKQISGFHSYGTRSGLSTFHQPPGDFAVASPQNMLPKHSQRFAGATPRFPRCFWIWIIISWGTHTSVREQVRTKKGMIILCVKWFLI